MLSSSTKYLKLSMPVDNLESGAQHAYDGYDRFRYRVRNSSRCVTLHASWAKAAQQFSWRYDARVCNMRRQVKGGGLVLGIGCLVCRCLPNLADTANSRRAERSLFKE